MLATRLFIGQYIFAIRLFTGLNFCAVHICHKTIHWTVLLYFTYLSQGYLLDCIFVQYIFATRLYSLQAGLYFCTLHICLKAIYRTVFLYGTYLPQGYIHCRLDCTFVLYIFASRLFTGLYFLPQGYIHCRLDCTFVQYMFATRLITGLYFYTVSVCH